MYIVNVKRIIEIMYGKGFNKTTLAKACNISRNTLSNYLKNPSKMPYTIISTMATVLCDTELEAGKIFFATKLS